MRNFARAFSIVWLAGLSDCMTVPAGSGTDALTIAKKALTTAHIAHNAAAVGLSAAANTGACKGSCAAQAKDLLDKSEDYLKAADTAEAVGDATTIQSQVKAANSFIAQVQTLTGKH